MFCCKTTLCGLGRTNTSQYFLVDEQYAHIVLKSKNSEDLFNLKSLLALCRIEHEFIEAHSYKDLCVTNKDYHKKCCKPWSVANYIAILHNRTSCLAITVSVERWKSFECSQLDYRKKILTQQNRY